jgi:hypothetical protein
VIARAATYSFDLFFRAYLSSSSFVLSSSSTSNVISPLLLGVVKMALPQSATRHDL